MNRRHFVKSAIAGTLIGKSVIAQTSAASANEKVNVAFIGIRGRGKNLIGSFAALPDVNIAYLCDVDQKVLESGGADIEKKTGKKPQLAGDLRRVLDDKSVDAVVIATPDHWHAPATILACDAGKDVYVEKPASHNLKEGRLMVDAARRNKRVVQHGTQSRSRPSTQRAVEYVKSGKIGKVYMAKAWDVQLRDDIGHKEDSSVPQGVDYETWTGPALMLPFNENRFHYNWHWHWNYGTGDMGNDGVHQLDIARWALGVDHPTEVSGMGRKLFFQDDQQTPDTMNISLNFKDKVIQWEMRIWNPYMLEGVDNGVAIYGSDGMVHIGRWKGKSGFKVFDGKGEQVLFDDANEGDYHARNFIDCVRSRKSPNAEIEIGHISTVYAHLGNIVARTGRKIKFDGETESILSDPDTSRLLTREYRQHWATPKGVRT
ncbi:MAG: Gfo/Idh/MocA family oxidoreductase [Pyrinomonadaceae bacterium]|nr:Gfo/Idh/MocA family oxidoreductase [Pyrinomonadaceae bacterium]